MKRLLSGCVASVLLGFAIQAAAQDQSQDPGSSSSQSSSSSSGSTSGRSQAGRSRIAVSEKATVEATVKDVDKTKHVITFTGSEGDTIKLKYDEQKNPIMAQLNKGDQVTLNYMRSAAIRLAKPGEEPTGREQDSYVLVPQKGASPEPGAIAVNTIKTSATVEDIDPQKRMVTLKDADGDTIKLKVDERVQNLDRIKKGDQIMVTYTEAAEVSVKKKGA